MSAILIRLIIRVFTRAIMIILRWKDQKTYNMISYAIYKISNHQMFGARYFWMWANPVSAFCNTWICFLQQSYYSSSCFQDRNLFDAFFSAQPYDPLLAVWSNQNMWKFFFISWLKVSHQSTRTSIAFCRNSAMNHVNPCEFDLKI